MNLMKYFTCDRFSIMVYINACIYMLYKHIVTTHIWEGGKRALTIIISPIALLALSYPLISHFTRLLRALHPPSCCKQDPLMDVKISGQKFKGKQFA